jgi:hypothetical protein
MRSGQRLPAFAGNTIITDMTVTPLPGGERVLTPTPIHTGATWFLFVDRVFQAEMDPLESVILPAGTVIRKSAGFVEAVPGVDESDGARLFAAIELRVTLTWAAVTGASRYLLARRASGGTYDWTAPLKTIYAGGDLSYTDTPGNGTWYWTVRAEDAAGNATDSDEATEVMDGPPGAPADLALDLSVSGEGTFTWTAGTGVSKYRLYFTTSAAGVTFDVSAESYFETTDAFVTIPLAGVPDGHYWFLLRALDADDTMEMGIGNLTEGNVSGGLAIAAPNVVTNVAAAARSGGVVRVTGNYDRTAESGVATHVHLFRNNGAGGAVDYGSVIGTAALGTTATLQRFTVDSPALTDGLTYIFGVKAATVANVESALAPECSATADATGPAKPTLTAVTD